MNTYLARKQPDQAIDAAQAQIAKASTQSQFYDLLGTVLFNAKKDLAGAETAFKKAAELDKNNADALLKLGQVQVAKGSTEEAIATYQNSIKDNPREASLYILTGELYESQHNWEQAKQMYQKALEIKPENALASNNLAYVMLQTGGNVDVAMSLAQTARRGMPDSPNAADTLGWVLYQKGAYKSAIDLFQEALRLGEKTKAPESATVHYHLGLAYEKAEQPALAKQHLQRVLKINPNYSDAADVKKQLAQLAS
jgi:tetratricopeptide (TPR) repeat protein